MVGCPQLCFPGEAIAVGYIKWLDSKLAITLLAH
jgi:hypothetical protein